MVVVQYVIGSMYVSSFLSFFVWNITQKSAHRHRHRQTPTQTQTQIHRHQPPHEHNHDRTLADKNTDRNRRTHKHSIVTSSVYVDGRFFVYPLKVSLLATTKAFNFDFDTMNAKMVCNWTCDTYKHGHLFIDTSMYRHTCVRMCIGVLARPALHCQRMKFDLIFFLRF